MPDRGEMRPIAKLRGRAVKKLTREAKQFLGQFQWCRTITRGYLAWAIAPCVGVFLFELVPSSEGVDNELWVIVGDLPPAYLVCDNASTWQDALDGYCEEMTAWVEAVRNGRSTEHVIPVNAPATQEYAKMLERRIEFIRERFTSVPPETLPTDA